MDHIIEVEKKTPYGKAIIYPINEQAKLLCLALNQKSLTQQNVDDFKLLGFVFKQVLINNGKTIDVGEL